MSVFPARQPEIIRAAQKDEFYSNVIKGSLADVFQLLVGARKWLQWRRELELLADVAYLGLTTLSGFQTLGEEYVNAVQVDGSGRRVPSATQRVLYVLLRAALPYLLERTLVRLEHAIQQAENNAQLRQRGERRLSQASSTFSLDDESHLRVAGGDEPPLRRLRSAIADAARRARELLAEASLQLHRRLGEVQDKQRLLRAVQTTRQALAFLHRLHVSLFYIRGVFYDLAKRVAGIRYVLVRGYPQEDAAMHRAYRLLGALSLVQLAGTLALCVRRAALARSAARPRRDGEIQRAEPHSPHGDARSDGARGSGSRCSLCLEPRRHATATPCGHLFCWACITEWAGTKAECPLCREKFQPHRLIYLRNYR